MLASPRQSRSGRSRRIEGNGKARTRRTLAAVLFRLPSHSSTSRRLYFLELFFLQRARAMAGAANAMAVRTHDKRALSHDLADTVTLLSSTPAPDSRPPFPPPAYGSIELFNAAAAPMVSAAPEPVLTFRIPAPTYDELDRRHRRTSRAVLGLAITQMILWFPLGFLYLVGLRGRRGRAHWRVACFFLALALWASVALSPYVPSCAIFLLHTILAVRIGAKGRTQHACE